MKGKGTNVEIPISISQKRAKLTMNSVKMGSLWTLWKLLKKNTIQLTVQYSLDEACMQAIMWVILDRPRDPWAKRILYF